MSWQSIDSAPKTGEWFCAWSPYCDEVFEAKWDDIDRQFISRDYTACYFTKWVDLPYENRP